MKALGVDNRATPMIVLENVCSALPSHVGRDFAAIGPPLSSGWYRFGGLVIEAPRFVSQSHPRFFIVAVRASLPGLISDDPAFDRDDVTGNRRFTNDLRPDRGSPTSAPTNAAAWIAGIVIVAAIII
jgi:site-specific DNA-cytosine methylase